MFVQNQTQCGQIFEQIEYSRFVAKGYVQTYDISYEEIYYVITKMTTMHRTIIVMTITKGWYLHQMNIKMYLYIKNKNIYTHGATIKLCGSNTFPLVCKLKKILFGLK